jgi:hypothetical protein
MRIEAGPAVLTACQRATIRDILNPSELLCTFLSNAALRYDAELRCTLLSYAVPLSYAASSF